MNPELVPVSGPINEKLRPLKLVALSLAVLALSIPIVRKGAEIKRYFDINKNPHLLINDSKPTWYEVKVGAVVEVNGERRLYLEVLIPGVTDPLLYVVSASNVSRSPIAVLKEGRRYFIQLRRNDTGITISPAVIPIEEKLPSSPAVPSNEQPQKPHSPKKPPAKAPRTPIDGVEMLA